MAGISLDFVASGWESSSWVGGFYPDDLPEDWRLAYYSNEFPSVLLPASRWMSAKTEEWETWLMDSPERFRFYLELPIRASTPELPGPVCELLGGRLSGGLVTGPMRAEVARPVAGPPCFRLLSDDSPGGLAGCLPAVSPPEGEARDLRAAQEWLTGLGRRFEKGPVLVVLAGESADTEALRRWWQLAWLMGLA